jgi:hypothetical protein
VRRPFHPFLECLAFHKSETLRNRVLQTFDVYRSTNSLHASDPLPGGDGTPDLKRFAWRLLHTHDGQRSKRVPVSTGSIICEAPLRPLLLGMPWRRKPASWLRYWEGPVKRDAGFKRSMLMKAKAAAGIYRLAILAAAVSLPAFGTSLIGAGEALRIRSGFTTQFDKKGSRH